MKVYKKEHQIKLLVLILCIFSLMLNIGLVHEPRYSIEIKDMGITLITYSSL